MAIAFVSQYPQVDSAMTQRVIERVNAQLAGQPPAGPLYHAEGATDDGGWWTFDVWTSEEARQQFAEQILKPALQAANVPPAHTRQLQVQWETSQVRSES